MRKVILTLILGLAATMAFAAPSVLRKSGDCKLQVTTNASDPQKVMTVLLTNADVEVTCKFRGGDLVGEFTLFAFPTIVNKSGKELSVAYQVAFFDKAG